MYMRTLWKRGVAAIVSLAVLIPSMLMPMAGTTVLAAEEVKPQIATPSAGMRSMDKIVYSANAVDFGADNTGANDSTGAIQNAINKVNDIQGGVVFLPAGRYKVEGTLEVPSGVTLRGEWVNPDEGGLGKGTILMAYAGRGNTNPTDSPFVHIKSGSCLRDISIWYPEQDPANPVPYPATIRGEGHTDVINVTLYNSYYGFYNNSCSSMLIRQLYGTVLYRGIHGAFAYDIPRIENVYFDTRYWAESGLANAPAGDALTAVNTYAENNLIAIHAGEQDWGYWYDINVNHAKYGLMLTAVLDDPGQKVVPGNIAAGKVTTRNTQIGVYMENVGYPGFQLTYSDIEATQYGMYYAIKPDYSQYDGLRVDYYDNATIVISASSFKGGKAGFWSDKTGGYNINFNDCTFEGWSDYAIRLQDGSLTCSNSQFKTNKTPLSFTANVDQAVMLGNTVAASTLISGNGWSNNDSRITRDDACKEVLSTPDYDYTYVSDVQPATDALFNAADYGAVAGRTNRIPDQDSTAAIQRALDAAKAAGGGTVYLPAGVYRMNGGVTVPTGVELRGSFDSAHYGNSTSRGTHLYAYGGKDNINGTPLITLEKGAGVKGFSVFYPEQGYSDNTTVEEYKVHAYPPTVRANQDTWIQNMAITACYTAIDAMSNNCSNIVITDVTGAALYASLELGHGTDGGYVQNLHFNYSGWTQQGAYASRPSGDDRDVTTTNGLLSEYTTRVVKGIILGDAKNVNFFSSFNILVAEQIVLQKDPYTGGDFEGVMWGVAFDAAMYGVIGTPGSNAKLAIVSSMGVFNRQGGGYNVWTQPGFTGRVSLYNSDAWDAVSKLVYVEGGTVDLVQYFSWCVHNGVCKRGGTLNVLGSTMVSNNGDGSGTTPDYTYETGAMGKVYGNLDCKQMLNIITQYGSFVDKQLNGKERQGASGSTSDMLIFSDFNNRDRTADNRGDQKIAMDTGWVTYDGGSNSTGVDMSKSNPANVRLQMTVTLTKTDCTDPDEEVFATGNVQIRSTNGNNGERLRSWSVSGLDLKEGDNYLNLSLADARAGSSDLDVSSINRVRIYVDSINRYYGLFTMQVRDVRVLDVNATDSDITLQRQQLGDMLGDQLTGDDLSDYTADSIARYNALYTAAGEVYTNTTATSEQLIRQILSLNQAEELLVKRQPTADAANRIALLDALNAIRSNSDLATYTSSSVRAYRALFTTARAVYNDLDATNEEVLEQVEILQTADDLLEVYTPQIVPLISGSRNSNVAHYMNVFEQYVEPVDLTQYGQRMYTDIRLRVRVNKDEASFPATVAPYGPEEWLRYVRNGAIGLWAGSTDNANRYWVSSDLDCTAVGNPMEPAVLGEFVDIYLPVPAEVIAAGRIDKFELYIYNDLHNFMKEKDPDHADQYTEKNEGSNGLSITVENVELVLGPTLRANTTALEAAISQAAVITNLNNYTAASAEVFRNALAHARELLETEGVEQSEVDAAALALTAAQNALIRISDKTALQAAIALAEEAVSSGAYTQNTLQDLQAALETAKTVAAKDDATQIEVDLAVNALKKAQNALVAIQDTTALQAAIAHADELVNSGLYTEESLAEFILVLNMAKKAVEDETLLQEQLDRAVIALRQGEANLVKRIDWTALKDAIVNASTLPDIEFTTESLEALEKAIADGEALVDAPDVTQEQVDAAAKAINDAFAGLTPKVYVTYGDINGDGDATAEDALLALQISTSKIKATDAQETAGNVDGVAGIQANDALMILQYATKKIASLTPKG